MRGAGGRALALRRAYHCPPHPPPRKPPRVLCACWGIGIAESNRGVFVSNEHGLGVVVVGAKAESDYRIIERPDKETPFGCFYFFVNAGLCDRGLRSYCYYFRARSAGPPNPDHGIPRRTDAPHQWFLGQRRAALWFGWKNGKNHSSVEPLSGGALAVRPNQSAMANILLKKTAKTIHPLDR